MLGDAKKAQTDEEKVRLATDLVVAFRTEHPKALEWLRTFYENGSEAVRGAIVAALAYRKWPGGLTLLDEIATSDPDALLRERAEETARLWRENRDRWEADSSE